MCSIGQSQDSPGTSSARKCPVMPGFQASPPLQAISPNAMTTIASCMPTLKACIYLAAKLNFSGFDLLQIKTFDEMTAQRVLNKWYARDGENATGQVLYDALCAIGLEAIAKQHQGILLENGE